MVTVRLIARASISYMRSTTAYPATGVLTPRIDLRAYGFAGIPVRYATDATVE